MKKTLGLFILVFAACELRAASLPRIILVLPFENQSGRSDLNWISEGSGEILATRLASPSRVVLGRQERDAAYEQLDLPPGTPLTLASVYKVAEVLGADWVVTGSFDVEDNRLTERVQLLDARRLKLVPALDATGELADLVELQTQLAWRLLATQDPDFTAGKMEDFRRLFPPIRLDAFENYVRGILTTDAESRVRFLGEADRLDPADRRAALELGRYYFDQKDYAHSAEWLRKLDSSDAGYLESLFYLGVDEFFTGQDAMAEQAFAELCRQIPLNEVWNNLGFMQARRGQYADAVDSFERAYQGDPTDPVFCFNLGACLWYLKRYREAAGYLDKAVRLASDDPEAHTLLAAALGAAGDAAGKQREFQWLAEHEGSVADDISTNLLPNLRLKKNYDGRAFRLLSLVVDRALERRLEDEPPERHGAVHLARGKELLAAGRLLEAGRELTEAVSLLPADSEAHLALGRVYQAQGRQQQAVAELESSLKLKDSTAAHLALAQVYLSLDRPEAAWAHARAALSLDPGNPAAQKLMQQIGDDPQAARRKP
jgi:tetratricopeptide (TPR) repeat protein